jgi:hypothetical protein
MSGYKRATVTISEQEYRRLHDADMKRRFGRKKRENQESSEIHLELSNTLQQMESRQRQLESILGGIDDNFNRVEMETMQNIIMQNAWWYESVSAMIEETAANASDSIAGMSQLFEENLLREREQYRQNLHTLVHQLDEHRQKEHTKEKSARQWLKRAVTLADFIQHQYNHELFLPGRLTKLYNRLGFAQNNLAEGLSEASLQISQQTYLELSELHFELEQQEIQRSAGYERICQETRQILEDMESGREVNAIDMQGEELPEKVELDYWTSGNYQRLLKDCRKLFQDLVQDAQHISDIEISRIHDQILPAFRASFDSIIYEARLNVLNSHLRMNIAEKAQQALERHGYHLCDEGYASYGDMRGYYKVQLKNRDGTQVTIQVLPKEDTEQQLTNDLVVITEHPYLKTEQEARMKWDEIHETLTHYNLNVSRPQTETESAVSTSESPDRATLQTGQPIRIQRKNHV